jgi:hypothetical protein
MSNSASVWFGDNASGLIVLAACLSILAGALILSPAQPGIDAVQLGGNAIPSLCTFRNITGLPCPGCGLTRSIVAAAHTEFSASINHHRLGLAALGYILFQIAYQLTWFILPSLRNRISGVEKLLGRGLISLGILLALNWIATLSSHLFP